MKTILDFIANILDGVFALITSFVSFLIFFSFAGTLYIGICFMTRFVLQIVTTLLSRI